MDRLTGSILEDMQKSDTMGINTWISHPLVPTFFVTEVGKRNSGILSAIRTHAEKYRDTPVILKDADYADPDAADPEDFDPIMRKNILVSREELLRGYDRKTVSESLSCRQELQHNFDMHGAVPRRRGTAVYATLLGYLLGYTEVILVGVDIITSRHFGEPVTPENSQPHICEDPSIGVPISAVFLGIKDALFSNGRAALKAVYPSPAFCGEIQEHILEK